MPSQSSESGTRNAEKPRARRLASGSNLSPKSSPSQRLVLGLDASLTGFGLVVWDGSRVLRKRRYTTEPLTTPTAPRGLLASGKFRGSDEERIEFLARKVVSAVRRYGVYFCVIEDAAFNAKGRGKTILSELNGVVKNRLMKNGVIFIPKAPTTLKKHFTGSGKASKEEMLTRAQEIDPDILSDDVADALAAASFGFDHWDEYVDESL